LTLGFIQQAGDVLHEGLRLTPPYAKNHVSLFAMHTLLASIAGAKHDEADRLRWLQQSEPYLGVDHPEEAFGLGAAYAGTTPPQNERASRLLRGFIKQTCGAGAAPIDELECETARQLVARLQAP
jgi:hypothetical protein